MHHRDWIKNIRVPFGDEPPPVPTPVVVAPQVTPPVAPINDPTKILLTPDEYKALLKSQMVANQADEAAKQAEARKAAIAAEELRKQGDPTEAIRLAQEKFSSDLKAANDATTKAEAARLAAEATTSKAQDAELRAAIAVAVTDVLAGRTFRTPEMAKQARILLTSELEASRDASGVVVVKQRGTGTDASTFLTAALDSEAYTHFQPAKNPKGGSGTGGGDLPAANMDSLKPAAQAIFQRTNEVRNQQGVSSGIGLAHHNFSGSQN